MFKKISGKKITLSILNSDNQSSISFSFLKFFGIFVLFICVVFFSSFLVFKHTSLKNYFFEENNISELQSEISELKQKMIGLMEHNLKIKNILGESLSKEDSLFLYNVRSSKERENKIFKSAIEKSNLLNIFSNDFFLENVEMQFPFFLPVDGYISREFSKNDYHFGIDLVPKNKNLVHSISNGFVVFSAFTNDNGNMIIIAHSDGYLSIYKHLENIMKPQFSQVEQNEVIGTVGNTGYLSYGTHLHFEILKNGEPLNPSEFFLNTN